MKDIFKKYEDDDIRLSIIQDEDSQNPREWENVGTMVCFHSRYTLGDEHHYDDDEDWIEDLANDLDIKTEVNDNGYWERRDFQDIFEDIQKQAVILPLYLYDHSGLRMSTSSFCDRWDSGQVGWIYCTYDKVKEEYGEVNETNIEKVKQCMAGEVETYDQWLRNDVYGYILERKIKCECCGRIEYEGIDSCFGFYGDDFKNNGIAECLPEEYVCFLDKLEYVF